MTNDILVFVAAGPLEILIILITLGIPILLIVLLVKYLARGSKERQKLRLELGKLADELEQVRKRAEERKKDEPSTKSE